MPQALAWNIGTIGRLRSSDDSPIESAMHWPIAWSMFERCE